MTVSRRHQVAIELGLVLLVASLAALGVSTVLRGAVDDLPPPPAPAATAPAAPLAPLDAYAVIAERDLFNPPRGATATRTAAGTLRLWGVGFRGHEALAVIEDTTTHHQELYRVGDRLAGVRVAAIDWDRVTLEDAGGEQVLELAPPAEAATSVATAEAPPADAPTAEGRIRRTGENAFVVDRRELVGAADNVSGLLTQLRAVAEVRDGRPAGFRLFRIREGSLFARLGLQDGDVVQRVNGSEVGEPSALLGFLQRLSHEPRVALDIVRADRPRTLVYDLR